MHGIDDGPHGSLGGSDTSLAGLDDSLDALDAPFLRALRSAVRPLDLLAIGAVPLALLCVFALPESVRRSLAFSYTDPTLWTAFTANYVHLGADHLLSNVLVYGLVVPLVYLLSVLSGRRDRFVVAFTTILLAFPIALSLLNLAVSRPGGTVGFSGITMAFVGFLPLALAGFVAARFDVDAELDLAGALFFAGLALAATLAVGSSLSYAGAAAATLLAVVFVRSALAGQERTRPDARAALQAGGYLELAAVSFVLFAGLPVLAFPSDPVVDGTVVNLYVHLLGYALGFISTYATVYVSRRLSARSVRSARPVRPTDSAGPATDRRPVGTGDADGRQRVATD